MSRFMLDLRIILSKPSQLSSSDDTADNSNSIDTIVYDMGAHPGDRLPHRLPEWYYDSSDESEQED